MREIHILVTLAGFSYWDCYEMPIHIRKYHHNKYVDEVNEANTKSQSNKANNLSMEDMISKEISESKLGIKNKKPDYISKTSR